jgi:hypothetical protein
VTAIDVFGRISAHQTEGLMLHSDMADYFDFLGLKGFKRLHEYQYISESVERRGVHRYVINHFNTLPNEDNVSYSSVIPSAWRNFTRETVESGVKKDAVRSGMEKWVSWERDTKKLYESAYKELQDIGEIAASCKVKELIEDVDHELKCAERLHIEFLSVDYDMEFILSVQKEMHDRYKKKAQKVGVSIC